MAPSPKTPPNSDSTTPQPPIRPDAASPIADETQFVPIAGGGNQPQRVAASPAGPSLVVTESTAEMPAEPETILGEFRLLRRLGRGGMAEVYLAEQTLLKRYVAIKVMRPELTMDESLRQRFQKEALAVAGLNHPNIVQVYTVGDSSGRFYIAQEYVNGQNLREFLMRKGPPELQVALIIMKQVAAALQAAAQAGIVHRDIKPENIMLGRKSEVKVTDFGLAKRGQTADSQQLTQFGTTMGTPLYMSPEQIHGKSVDHRSDLYSYGVTCYHMLAGQPPFRGESAISIAMQHLKETPRPLEKLRPDLPPLLCRIIHKCMEKDPDERYQSAASVIKDLRRVTQDPTASNTNQRPSNDRPVTESARPPIWSTIAMFLRNPASQAIALADLPVPQQAKRLAITAVVVLGIFAGLGWIRRPANPLTLRLPPKPGNRAQVVPQEKTAAEQYWQASKRINDIQAWEAVGKNFPNDKIFTPAALIELGLRYLADRRPSEASACFDQLVAYGEIERQWQTAGWAGQAAVMAQQGDAEGAFQLLIEKVRDRQKDLPRRVADLPRQTSILISGKLSAEKSAQLRQAFDDSQRRPNPPPL